MAANEREHSLSSRLAKRGVTAAEVGWAASAVLAAAVCEIAAQFAHVVTG